MLPNGALQKRFAQIELPKNEESAVSFCCTSPQIVALAIKKKDLASSE